MKFNQSNNSSSPIAIVGMVLAGFVGLLALGNIGKASNDGSLVLPIVWLVGAIAAFVVCLRENIAARKRHAAKRVEFEAPYENRIQEIEQLMKKTREIVDDR